MPWFMGTSRRASQTLNALGEAFPIWMNHTKVCHGLRQWRPKQDENFARVVRAAMAIAIPNRKKENIEISKGEVSKIDLESGDGYHTL